jgi:alkyl sulfatase BDS1-like metallo-beta-lactamase superfamily hydrolase
MGGFEMKVLRCLQLGIMLGVVLVSGSVWAEQASRYNISLQDKVITGPKGSLTSPQAASVNKKGQIDEKNVRKIADGIYHPGEHAVSHCQQLSHVTGAVTPEKLAASPLNDNVQYMRFMVDPRLAEGKRAEFNVNFRDEEVGYAIALRNGMVGITDQPNKGQTIELSKDDWSKLITGKKSFAGLHASLKAFDKAIGR